MYSSPTSSRHRAGERDQRLDVGVALLRDVLVELLLVAHRVRARAGHDHRLRPAADLVAREGAEVLDHHLGLLGDVVRMQAHEARQRPGGLLLVHLGIVLNGLDQPVVGLVGRVVLQHVQDEAFLDGLPHAVEVERLRLAALVLRPNISSVLYLGVAVKAKKLRLRLLAALGHRLQDFFFVVGQPLFFRFFLGLLR